ncbi:aspartate carbamoyltransferase regulatory subunit [Candidatus Ishikawella capsulata]|uniref:Aspartate carbamoyltransferase regulatory chain n=1 Tax=Candidatus Ishikawaella capsulata Mpkobe TaxID=476281 RepID=C5WCV1_9ENTR|nr:aspartate carbamoyltransferase regulatory subunit [Candidatus Ishikawaella capsulata]BAH83157.1 aspartate carbamoyltransferase regulatory subunit [Candidatus Ishikawaella capsulata Mpkobe]
MIREKNIQVEAIKIGTVIDHIPAHFGFKILSLFCLSNTEKRITIGLNLPSQVLERKDLIKIENFFLTQDQINNLAIYAPYSTINCINDYEVIAKISPLLPEYVNKILICTNSNCISNSELINSCFRIKNYSGEIFLKCRYCENEFPYNILISNQINLFSSL